ncbi:hypothetical protein V490_08193 [Pseudogymnoascus sp. VKM F-3557]|nr:hypothetical protein V490_08193 [Pseudogymnoascus sp. VKM F-3557]
MDIQALSLAGAALVIGGSYINARYGIGTDIREIRHEKNGVKRLLENYSQLGESCTIYNVFSRADPTSDALWFEGQTWTYGQLKQEVDRLSSFLHEKGVQTGDFIGVFMSNSPEMVMAILALQKLGAVAALLNTNLRDDPLNHCLNVSNCSLVLSTPELSDALPCSLPHFSLNFVAFPNTPAPKNPGITLVTLPDLPTSPASLPTTKRSPKDLACLIYTSGTTGKPKACAIRNAQMIATGTMHPHDYAKPQKYFPLRTYSALPLFHGTCLFTGFCYVFGTGGCFILARKFSTSRFFKDVTESRATRILYVGELCRYLVNSPPSPYDRSHNCIVANGNGLRPEIWEKFKNRFAIPEIREFYRSTEGLGKFDNFGVGAWGAGRLAYGGPVRRWYENDTFIVKFDTQTELPYRDPKTGFCVKCELGEAGEVIGRVKDRGLLTEYLGNSSATEEKLIKDVFVKGDLFQKMGDLVIQDRDGWVYFHDRIGDTFRWKGENVSAGEVRDHVAALPGVEDVVVYGVALNGYDGKAGAAAITLLNSDETRFMATLYGSLRKTGLPVYAIPRLVRITKEIATGVTFKQAKGDFLKKSWVEGENGDLDALYWLNGKRFEKLTEDSWAVIVRGEAKLIMPRQIIPAGIAPDGLDNSTQITTLPTSKRKARKLGLNAKGQPIKRRALKACHICRSRKVRCDVVQHGVPCSNCQSGAIPCTVPETKHKNSLKIPGANVDHSHPRSHLHSSLPTTDVSNDASNPIDIFSPDIDDDSSRFSSPLSDEDESGNDMLHPLVSGKTRLGQPLSFDDIINSVGITGDLRASRIKSLSPPPMATAIDSEIAPRDFSDGFLPAYIQPLPTCMATEDIMHLWKKGATAIPEIDFRNELLRSYIEFVHPYMPLLDLHDFLRIVNKGTGENGRVSLLLFQAVMFAGVAFVDGSYLTAAGYPTRRSARRDFYLKTRALYDFDYESDGVIIVQSLLLMSFWLETHNGQKDTWHWIGAAISTANSIGLHCNPANSTTDVKTQKLWKRIWWSCLMRDRLASLGLRRIPRTKDDHDVPMLTLADFDIRPLAADNTIVPPRCKMIRDVEMQKDLALLCISQAKLSLCISHVLSTQYSVLIRDQGMVTNQDWRTRPSAVLLPRNLEQTDEVNSCDSELAGWVQSLPSQCIARDPTSEEIEGGASTVIVQRTLLHMLYYATLAALHRPQLQKHGKLQDDSRNKVHKASCEITRMAQSLHNRGLTGYLYNAGLTVLLPAIIIHLLALKSTNEAVRYKALQRFCQCMQVVEKLRENYMIIDCETQFLDAVIQKSSIDIDMHLVSPRAPIAEVFQPKRTVQSVSELVAAGHAARLTPPPENDEAQFSVPDYSTTVSSIGDEPFMLFSATNAFPSSTSDVFSSGNDDASRRSVRFINETKEAQRQHCGGEEFGGLIDTSTGFENEAEITPYEEWGGAALEDGFAMTGELGGFTTEADLMDYDGLAEGYNWALGSPNDKGQELGRKCSEERHSKTAKELNEDDMAMSFLMEWCEGNID